ncbi:MULTISPECIES: anthranilate synthase component I [Aestuariimicrobium]|uniref:anthranilate synthase component I n=1 Tax=Aestuariimicrobium TaxID=396388 RepID=UPI0003B6082C|nr:MULTISPECIES: anthranilate synthase component I [Aestuariimicrobium]CAI9410215.1 Anthranilate synthase component 1 [Aestuariimicrobium sp. T2.26MG-19.2B]
MTITPSLHEFRRLASQRRVISVHRRVLVDDLTPIGIHQTLCGDRVNTFLLESADAGVWSRWSFIGVNCSTTLTETDGQAVWLGRPIAGLPTEGDVLEVLGATIDALHTEPAPDLPPFTSGLVGYLGYDCVRHLEKLPETTVDDLGIPELMMLVTTDLAAYDHHTGELWLIANAINFDDSDAGVDEAWRDAVSRVDAMADVLARPRGRRLRERSSQPDLPIHWQRGAGEYQQMVRDAVEEIRAGEAFQVVPSQRFELATNVPGIDVYRELRLMNPSPYMYLLTLPGFEIVGASPEALVTVVDGRAATNPIAGTRPRGATMADDQRNEEELLADPKERAEHIMLVDLGRNDLGRVCSPGTVEVTEFMKVARYSHVMHLEARVEGEVAEGRNALDVTLACFPAGTLSGAPKVRAMEIIDRLELTRRGVYGGVVGYFDFAGNADTAIGIRTALLKDGRAYVQAGAGIVADSVPDTENDETQHKARSVVNAVRRAAGVSR